MRQPTVRARGVQWGIEFADSFDGRQAAVTSIIDDRVLEHVMSLLPTAWVPYELERHFVDAIYEVHGPERSAACWRACMVEYANGPLLGSFVAMSKRLFGLSPAAVVRAGPRGWLQSYRDFCELRGELLGDGRGVIRFTDVHPEVYESIAYPVCFASLFEGFCDIVGGAQLKMMAGREERSWDLHVHW